MASWHGFSLRRENGKPAWSLASLPSHAHEVVGTRVTAAVRQAAGLDGDPLAIWGEPRTLPAMSRLARLDAARLISSMPESPLWSVEAAQLAARAVSARMTAEARRAASELASAADLSPYALAAAAGAVAELVAAAEPDLASELRGALAGAGEPPPGCRKHARPPTCPTPAR